MLSQTIQVARYYSASSNACLDRNRPSVPASPASESATNAISVPPIKQPGLREISSRGFCMSVPTSESAIKVQQFGSRSGLRGPSTPNKGRWNTGHTIQIGFVVDIPREKTSSRATPSPVRTIKNLEGVIPARRQDANAQISADIGASSAAGCLLEDVLSSFASKDRPQLPTMAKSFEKVPNTLNMSFNKLGNDCDMRLHILDGCNKYLSQSTHFIHLTAGEQRGEGTATFNIPKPVAFVSPTIQHIYNGSVHFIEGVENVIRFPTVDRDVLADIVAFLYWDWCRIHLPEIYKALGLRSEEKGDIAEATPGYRPKLESVLELMEAAVYLDLPILVGKCADVAAENIEVRHFILWNAPPSFAKIDS
ncbi:hypothetical protein DFS34DRAFT_271053 [Phlyctochytrium arcticum]|nr:hypothetical protein DFS34DRAFT_271053 [Phlyctochytrium arcticum]